MTGDTRNSDSENYMLATFAIIGILIASRIISQMFEQCEKTNRDIREKEPENLACRIKT